MKTIYFAYTQLFNDYYDRNRYYNFKEYDPESNRFVVEPRYVKEVVENLGYTIEIVTTKFAIKNDLPFFYEIGTIGSPENWFGFTDIVDENFQNKNKYINLFNMLEYKLIKKIQKRKCFLIINLPLEGFPFVNYERGRDLYFFIYKTLSEKKIPANQIIITTSNIKEYELHEKWCKENNITEKLVISPNYFFAHSAKNEQECLTLNDHVVYKFNNDIKLYSNLNRIVRDHRVLLGIALNNKKLIDLGHMSHDTISNNYSNQLSYLLNKYNAKDFDFFNNNTLNDFCSKLPLITDITDFSINRAVNFFNETYLRTWFSLITETYFFEYQTESIFYSEKTFKPIRARHPFVLVAPSGYLANLKNMGFKTFDNWWDESYDNEPNPINRIYKIVDLVESLSKKSDKEWISIYYDMKHVLDHNYNNLKDNTWNDDLVSTIKNIIGKM
jgi:hypothetical protein